MEWIRLGLRGSGRAGGLGLGGTSSGWSTRDYGHGRWSGGVGCPGYPERTVLSKCIALVGHCMWVEAHEPV